MLRCIQRKETEPHFNIAAEEYLLQHAITDTFMVWKNDPCVVVGKHQVAAREINHKLISEKGIPVIRRITGGGTVYQDHGNINFSFIRLNRKENPVDFKFFTYPIIVFLKSMGVNAVFEGKSNITVNGLKVSGNSAHVHKGRVLHHGTLLFNTDLDCLEKVIHSSEERYEDRSVKSIRKEVSNLSSHIKAEMHVDDFIESLFSFIINYYQDAYHDRLTGDEVIAISELAIEKYRDYNWNFGYSPDYQYSNSWNSPQGPFTLQLTTKEAVLQTVVIEGPEALRPLLRAVEEVLTGTLHESTAVINALGQLKINTETQQEVLNQILSHLF